MNIVVSSTQKTETNDSRTSKKKLLAHCAITSSKLSKSTSTGNAMPIDEPDFQSESSRQYRWAQSNPLSFSTRKTPLFINGKRQKHKSFYHSRQSHIALAQEYSRCATYRLCELDDSQIVFKGNVMMPLKTEQQWSDFWKSFNKRRTNYCQYHNVEICFLLKAHITKTNSAKQRDDIHYDYVAWSSSALSQRELSNLINGWIKKSGGRSKCECKIIKDRSPENIEQVSEYTLKSALPPSYLPRPEMGQKKLTVKTLGNFWGRAKESVSSSYYLNDELQTTVRELSPRKLVWLAWCKSIFNGEVSRYETADFCTSKRVAKTLSNQLSRAISVIGSCIAENVDAKDVLNKANHCDSGIFCTAQNTEVNSGVVNIKNYQYIGDIEEQMERHLKPPLVVPGLFFVGYRGRLFGVDNMPLLINGEQLNRLLDAFDHRLQYRQSFFENVIYPRRSPQSQFMPPPGGGGISNQFAVRRIDADDWEDSETHI